MLKITIFTYEKIIQKYQIGIRLLKVLIKYPHPIYTKIHSSLLSVLYNQVSKLYRKLVLTMIKVYK